MVFDGLTIGAVSLLSHSDMSSNSDSASVSSLSQLECSDSELLMRFARHQDEGAFEDLLRKHAPLVLATCRQLLNDQNDVEDAFQATFLVLVRRHRSIRNTNSVASWLYRVAYRLSMRSVQQRRSRREEELVNEPESTFEAFQRIHDRELRSVLNQELVRLPESYQAPLVLCYLQGKTQSEAAEELDCSDAAVKARLARARKVLRTRLVRRGIALSASMATMNAAVSQARPASQALVEQTLAHCVSDAFGKPITEASSSDAFSLATEGVRNMILTSLAKPALAIGILGLVAVVYAAGQREDASTVQAAVGNGSNVVSFIATDVETVEGDSPSGVSFQAPLRRKKAIEEFASSKVDKLQNERSYVSAKLKAFELKSEAKKLEAAAMSSSEKQQSELLRHSRQLIAEADAMMFEAEAILMRNQTEIIDEKIKSTKQMRPVIQPNDVVHIRVEGTFESHPINGLYRVEPSGAVPLGVEYGRISIVGMTVEEAQQHLHTELKKKLRKPEVWVTEGDFPQGYPPTSTPIESLSNELERLKVEVADLRSAIEQSNN